MTALAVALIGGLIGSAPGALATPGPAHTALDDPVLDAGPPPAVWPRPQSMRAAGSAVPLGGEAVLLADPDSDPYAVHTVEDILKAAGVRTVHPRLPGGGPVFRLGGAGAEEALRALRVPERGDLASGGYRIGSGRVGGRDTVALDGVGDDGLFHAAQTLRRLIAEDPRGQRRIPGVAIRDWPQTAVRGIAESFYGRPWTLQQRLEQLDFMGRTKQNRYLYAPGDDPYRQARWSEPYPAGQRAAFRALAGRAARNHVTVAWAVAPGPELCLSSDADVARLNRKFDAMWALGVRAFQLQFPDAAYSEWHCDADAETFGSGPRAAAAHARVANALAAHLAAAHPGSLPLSLLPAEYYQDGPTDYRRALAATLAPGIEVAWTGVGVVPKTITGAQLASARATFGHPVVTLDNYPVNDYAPGRILLGPYTGREPAVAGGSAALLASAMEQPTASRIPLFTAADFAWNPRGYRPQDSWRAAVDDLAGGDPMVREALGAVAGNDSSSVLGHSESAYLRPFTAAFWAARPGPDAVARDRAAGALRAAFTVLRRTSQRLARQPVGPELAPWTEQLARYGQAGELAVDLLQAQSAGHGAAAWRTALALAPLRERLRDAPVTVGEGVLDAFLDRAGRAADAWTGADHPPVGVTRSPDAHTVAFGRARPVLALTVLAEPGTPGEVQARVPGEDWHTLGPLDASGWTQLAADGVRADAVRVVGAAPGVRRLVPWYADEPAAHLALGPVTADAEIGGAPRRVTASVAAMGPGPVRGALTARAPRGVTVRLPRDTPVARGTSTDVPVEVSVARGTPAGSYRVPLSFAGQEAVLTVRAFPPTGGPDLVAGAKASSSGDADPGSPARAAADGDPASDWTPPPGDGPWWQAELAGPARVGRVVLQWRGAGPGHYAVRVSSDGRSWRTAAAVGGTGGGRVSVPLDAADTRFIRVQVLGRASGTDCSLWSVEAYAVGSRP